MFDLNISISLIFEPRRYLIKNNNSLKIEDSQEWFQTFPQLRSTRVNVMRDRKGSYTEYIIYAI